MAAFAKYKRDAAGRLLLHNNRAGDDGVTHENEEIDSERTHLNYYSKRVLQKTYTSVSVKCIPRTEVTTAVWVK